MATEGFVKFEYFSKGVPPYYGNSTFPELLDDESIVISTPNLEMSYHQYFGLFKKFLMSVGFDEKNIMQGACNLAFNEMNNEEVMREVAEEYELIMSEQLPDIIADRKKQDKEWIEQSNDSWEERYWALYKKFNKFASFTDEELQTMVDDALAKKTMTPWGHSDMEALRYSDDEMDAMCDAAEGSKIGFYKEDISNKDMWDQGMMKVSTNDPMKEWNGLVPGSPAAQAAGCKCPVLDNEEMPIDRKWVDVSCPLHGRK